MTTRRALGHPAASVAVAGAGVLLAALITAYVVGWGRAYLPIAMVPPLALIFAALGFTAGRRTADDTRGPRRERQTDPLTGLAGPSVLTDRLADLRTQPLRGDRHAAVLAIDLDHLADLNDRYGREAGDAVIVTAAAAACARGASASPSTTSAPLHGRTAAQALRRTYQGTPGGQ